MSWMPWETGLRLVQSCWQLKLVVLGAEQPCFSRAQGVTDTQFAAWQPAGTSLIKKAAQNRENGNE